MASRRCAGRTATPTKTIRVAEVLRVPSDRSCSAKEEKQHYKYKISAEPPLDGEVSITCKKNRRHDGRRPHLGHDGQHNHKPGTKAVNDINGAMADNPAALPSPPARAGMTAWTNGVDDMDE